MALPPPKYAKLFFQSITNHKVTCWLVNTGLVGGGFKVGTRISLPHTRELIHRAMSGELLQVPMEKDPIFGFRIPSTCGNVPGEILKPAQAWEDSSAYVNEAKKLAAKLIKNFRHFKHDVPRAVVKSGPMLDGD